MPSSLQKCARIFVMKWVVKRRMLVPTLAPPVDKIGHAHLSFSCMGQVTFGRNFFHLGHIKAQITPLSVSQ